MAQRTLLMVLVLYETAIASRRRETGFGTQCPRSVSETLLRAPDRVFCVVASEMHFVCRSESHLELPTSLHRFLASCARGKLICAGYLGGLSRDGSEGESPQSVPSGRPMRQTCMVARDHILAWRLQQQWSFRGAFTFRCMSFCLSMCPQHHAATSERKRKHEPKHFRADRALQHITHIVFVSHALA
eukprot:3591848-Rhodomonas_salina.1